MYSLRCFKLFVFIRIIDTGMCLEFSPSSGEYNKIVVKVHETTSSQNCDNVLQNLQILLESTSSSVGVASGWRVWPAHYIVVLPESWAESNCSTSLSIPSGNTRYKGVDILVHDGPLMYGLQPQTVQPRGCGEKGEYISLPLQLINSNTSLGSNPALGRVMAHQFFKLRFGVFDEMGYTDDPLYPVYYKYQDRILPTGPSNLPVKGVWLTPEGTSPCRPDRESCLFQPQGENDEISCSLGYLPVLTGVTGYCTPEQLGDHLPPTKHNVICGGRSVHDVIFSSEELRQLSGNTRELNAGGGGGGNSSQRDRVSSRPQIDFVLQTKEKFVLVMETSASMADNEDWKWIQKVAHKLVRYDLGRSVEVGVVSFSNVSKVEHPLSTLRDSRDLLADSVPDKYRLSQDNGRCVTCGLSTAVQEVLGADKTGAHLVLFTRGGEDTLSIINETKIKELVQQYQIKISTLILPGPGSSYLSFYDSLARMSGGRTVVVRGGGGSGLEAVRNSRVDLGVAKYLEMIEGMADILDNSIHRWIIQSKLHTVSSTEQESCGSFLAPGIKLENKDQAIQFGIIVKDEEDHLIRSVEFTDSKGGEWGPYRRVATTLDNINVKIINFGLSSPPPFHQGGEWRYKISWHPPPTAEKLQAGVVITSPRSPADILINFWTSSESSSDIVTAQHPLTLYVAVNRGLSPVLRALVVVSVKVMTENATVVSIPPFRLTDGGNGDPDMQGEDGIYSRYMTSYPAVGRYVFSITVADNSGQAVLVSKTRNLERRCCGSVLRYSADELEPTGAFNQVFSAPAINLIQVPATEDQDRMPPARIGNLRLKVMPETSSLMASWTAPGDDYDGGSVAGYRFLFSTSQAQLLDQEQDPAELVSIERADKAGVETSYTFKFNYYEQEFFIGILGVDEMNNTGKMSNIVSVVMPSIIADTVSTTLDRSVDISPELVSNDWTMIGALCGAILLLGIFLLLGILYFLKVSKPKKPVAVPVHSKDDGTDNSSCSSDSKNTSSHRLMPDITTIAGTLPTFTAPPSSLPDSTPTYWSATQLLTEHEQRALNLSYSAIHSPMETIREEYIGYPEEFVRSGSVLHHDPGITNFAFSRNNNGTPVHGVFGGKPDGSLRSGSYRLDRSEEPNDRNSAASSNLSESVISVGSNLYRCMGGSGVSAARDSDLEPVSAYDSPPVRYSTAVQTTAPSTIASLRQIRSRNVSLV